MLDLETHERNAFHYSCFGAGADEEGKNATVKVRIPSVIPDGVYVMGWAWYGGLEGNRKQNKVDNPNPRAYFGDHWSCAIVEIRGGQMEEEWEKMFLPNVQEWEDGCLTGADDVGICKYEPCDGKAEIMKPRVFRNGRRANILTGNMFTGPVSGRSTGSAEGDEWPSPVPDVETLNDALVEVFRCKEKREEISRAEEIQMKT